jgi:hypothetical protein
LIEEYDHAKEDNQPAPNTVDIDVVVEDLEEND